MGQVQVVALGGGTKGTTEGTTGQVVALGGVSALGLARLGTGGGTSCGRNLDSGAAAASSRLDWPATRQAQAGLSKNILGSQQEQWKNVGIVHIFNRPGVAGAVL